MAQIIKMSYFPQIRVVHTSKTFHGQLYVPVVNWMLMIGTVLVAAIYNNTTSLGNAYGVCVMFVTFFDTCMVTLVTILVWRWNPFLVFLPWLAIACMDGTFLSSALTKVPDGAWFTILLSCILAFIFILWRFGKESQWHAEAEDRFPTGHFVRVRDDKQLELSARYGSKSLSRIEGFGIFFDKAGETTPIVFSQFIRKLVTAPEVCVFFHLRPLETPTVAPENRYTVSRLGIPNCYRLIVRHGFMDEVVTPDLASLIFEKVRDHIIRRAIDREGPAPDAFSSSAATTAGINTTLGSTNLESSETSAEDGKADSGKQPIVTKSAILSTSNDTSSRDRASMDQSISARLEALDRAFNHEVLYVIGKEQMFVKAGTFWLRAALINAFLFIRDNTRPRIASLKVPRDKVIEMGFIKDV